MRADSGVSGGVRATVGLSRKSPVGRQRETGDVKRPRRNGADYAGFLRRMREKTRETRQKKKPAGRNVAGKGDSDDRSIDPLREARA